MIGYDIVIIIFLLTNRSAYVSAEVAYSSSHLQTCMCDDSFSRGR